MGTRADFYIGRGENAEWLGSIAWDGYPDGEWPASVSKARTEQEFRDAVAAMLSARDDATMPDQGWPWPWDTSHTTDWAYAWDGAVFGSCFGRCWLTADELLSDPDDRPQPDEKQCVFPDMSKRKNVTLGKRSGLIVLG